MQKCFLCVKCMLKPTFTVVVLDYCISYSIVHKMVTAPLLKHPPFYLPCYHLFKFFCFPTFFFHSAPLLDIFNSSPHSTPISQQPIYHLHPRHLSPLHPHIFEWFFSIDFWRDEKINLCPNIWHNFIGKNIFKYKNDNFEKISQSQKASVSPFKKYHPYILLWNFFLILPEKLLHMIANQKHLPVFICAAILFFYFFE